MEKWKLKHESYLRELYWLMRNDLGLTFEYESFCKMMYENKF